MKTRRVISLDEKRFYVANYYRGKDKEYLVSLVMALFTPEDVKYEYKNLPKRYKL